MSCVQPHTDPENGKEGKHYEYDDHNLLTPVADRYRHTEIDHGRGVNQSDCISIWYVGPLMSFLGHTN